MAASGGGSGSGGGDKRVAAALPVPVPVPALAHDDRPDSPSDATDEAGVYLYRTAPSYADVSRVRNFDVDFVRMPDGAWEVAQPSGRRAAGKKGGASVSTTLLRDNHLTIDPEFEGCKWSEVKSVVGTTATVNGVSYVRLALFRSERAAWEVGHWRVEDAKTRPIPSHALILPFTSDPATFALDPATVELYPSGKVESARPTELAAVLSRWCFVCMVVLTRDMDQILAAAGSATPTPVVAVPRHTGGPT